MGRVGALSAGAGVGVGWRSACREVEGGRLALDSRVAGGDDLGCRVPRPRVDERARRRGLGTELEGGAST